MTRAIRRHHRQRMIKRNLTLIRDAVWLYWRPSPLEINKRIPSLVKTMRRRIQRAKEKQAVRAGIDPPRFRRDNEWSWW